MKITIPETIDLQKTENYILTVAVYPNRFSFSFFDCEKGTFCFFFQTEELPDNAVFSVFKEVLFANDFLSLSYKKVYIINGSYTFTYIPESLFEEKDTRTYLNFLFKDNSGKILSEREDAFEFVIVHAIQEDIYEFLLRSFVNVHIVHYTAPIIHFLQHHSLLPMQYMVINKSSSGEMDIFCFSDRQLLLGNHFHVPVLKEAIYHSLFVWQQMNLNKKEDSLFIVERDSELTDSLKSHIRQIDAFHLPKGIFSDSIRAQEIPLEISCLALSYF
ncbi:MAG: DUF3822 family protein [Dysgonamonadaceae bacterium]|jgi:hypothetical protein|nr:DUF3822 family protein [Dysgonamonadaceae bacterium]